MTGSKRGQNLCQSVIVKWIWAKQQVHFKADLPINIDLLSITPFYSHKSETCVGYDSLTFVSHTMLWTDWPSVVTWSEGHLSPCSELSDILAPSVKWGTGSEMLSILWGVVVGLVLRWNNGKT